MSKYILYSSYSPRFPIRDGQKVHHVDELIVQLHPEGLRIQGELPYLRILKAF